MRRRAGANAGSLTGGGALTLRRRPGSDAGAGAAAAAAAAAAEEGEGQALVSFRFLVVACGSLVPFSWEFSVSSSSVGVWFLSRGGWLASRWTRGRQGCWLFRSVGLPGWTLQADGSSEIVE